MFSKVSKTIVLLRKLQKILPRPILITICKYFIRPHVDYRDIIYIQAYNACFHQKLESIQYNMVLAMAIRERREETSREKFHHELGFDSLESRGWYRKLCYFYKFCQGSAA